jgi:hypothetical protein
MLSKDDTEAGDRAVNLIASELVLEAREALGN